MGEKKKKNRKERNNAEARHKPRVSVIRCPHLENTIICEEVGEPEPWLIVDAVYCLAVGELVQRHRKGHWSLPFGPAHKSPTVCCS